MSKERDIADIEDDETHLIDPDFGESRQENDIFGEFAELDDAEIKVHRAGQGRKAPFLFAFQPSDYTMGALMEKLRDDYGSGEYILRLTDKGKFVKQRMVAVEKPKEAPAPVTPVAQQDTGNNLIMTMLMQQAERAEAAAQRSQEAMNNMMLALVKSSNQKSEAPSISELVASLAAIKQLEPVRENNNSGDMDMFLKGVEFGKEMAGGADESMLQTAIKSFAPALEKIAAVQAVQQVAPRPVPRQPVAGAIPAQRPAPVVEQAAQPADQIPEHYRVLLGMLVKAARSDADPEVYANLFLDQTPELLPVISDDMQYAGMVASLGEAGTPVIDWLDNWRELCIELGDVPTSDQQPAHLPVSPGFDHAGDSEGGDAD